MNGSRIRKHGFRWLAAAFALTACGDDPGSNQSPATGGAPTAGTSAGTSGGGGVAGGGVAGGGTGGAGMAGTGTAGSSGSRAGSGGASGSAGSAGMAMPMAGVGGASGVGAGAGAGAGAGGMAGAGTGGGGMAGAGTGGMSGQGGTGGMAGNGAGDAMFADVYMIIAAKCGGCHVSGSSGGLAMPDAATAYENLVDVNSEECDGETRVVAGDADASLLIKAIEGTACVPRMPNNRPALTAAEIMTFRAWVEAGAPE